MKTMFAAPLLLSVLALAQHKDADLDSPHFSGPRGLSGWIVSTTLPGLDSQGPLPFELVIARNGHIIRRLNDGSFQWKWSFQNDGRWVAYETGPLHFSLTCFLVDVASGRQLASFDCYNKDLLAPRTPAWVRQLEANGNSWVPASPHILTR